MKELLKRLIQAETTTQKGELAAANIIRTEFEKLGVDSQIDIWDQTRANITARIAGRGKKRGLLFASHLDVVPANIVMAGTVFTNVLRFI